MKVPDFHGHAEEESLAWTKQTEKEVCDLKMNITKSKYVSCSLIPNLSILTRGV